LPPAGFHPARADYRFRRACGNKTERDARAGAGDRPLGSPPQAVKILRTARESGRLPLDEVALYGALVHVVAQDMEQHRGAIAAELRRAGIEPGEMVVIEPSLEDVCF